MTYSQKYCLVHFLLPLHAGAEFSMDNWPLHVTLADVFAIDREPTYVEAQLQELPGKTAPVRTWATGDAAFGKTQVVLLEKTDDLMALHDSLADLLATNGAVFNNPEFMRNGFLPHCTVQKVGQLKVGEKLLVDSVSLVDMFPGGDWQQRKVLCTISWAKS